LCSQNCGPCFAGAGYESELRAGQPFNGEKKCQSFANEAGYDIRVEGGVNMLTNKEDGAFTISELEVWEVTGHMKDQFVNYDSEEVNPIREERKN
jgi:hypothetical protein